MTLHIKFHSFVKASLSGIENPTKGFIVNMTTSETFKRYLSYEHNGY